MRVEAGCGWVWRGFYLWYRGRRSRRGWRGGAPLTVDELGLLPNNATR
jgi:hypothetical protein